MSQNQEGHQKRFSDTHKETYFHFSDYETTVNGQPVKGLTVFCREEKDGTGWHLGLAFCSPRDQFARRIGRTRARRRYFENDPVPLGGITTEWPTVRDIIAWLDGWRRS